MSFYCTAFCESEAYYKRHITLCSVGPTLCHKNNPLCARDITTTT